MPSALSLITCDFFICLQLFVVIVFNLNVIISQNQLSQTAILRTHRQIVLALAKALHQAKQRIAMTDPENIGVIWYL